MKTNKVGEKPTYFQMEFRVAESGKFRRVHFGLVLPKAVGTLPVYMKSDSTKKKNSPKNVAPKGAEKPRKAPLKIPSILLEGDAPAEPQPGGPGKRYALGPDAKPSPNEASPEKVTELPESYGTKRLILTARDPHWIYAHWDLTREQQKEYNALSVDKHLVIRVYKNMVAGKPFSEVHVHPESRNWFLNVGDGGTKYIAELGYYQRNGKWAAISTSGATLTPPDTMSEDVTAWFETLPADLQYQQLLALVKQAASENVPLMEAIQQLRSDGHKHLPSPEIIASRVWTPAQEKALSELVSMDSVRRIWMGSLEITELIRRQWQQELASAAAAQFSQPLASQLGKLGSLGSISSPFGGLPRRKFWFNVNAELIIYGATEPDAEVSIGGRIIKLRSDGTFSYRFSLPDGRYELPAVAVSNDKHEQRSAALRFTRGTDYQGDVGQHPQDPALKMPAASNVE